MALADLTAESLRDLVEAALFRENTQDCCDPGLGPQFPLLMAEGESHEDTPILHLAGEDVAYHGPEGEGADGGVGVASGLVSDTQRVRDAFADAPTPRVRPIVVVEEAHQPQYPPQLGDAEGQPYLQVPADGMCMYYCVLACQDAQMWLLNHDSATGLNKSIPLREVDLVAAAGVRDAVVKTAADLGDVETSRRLSLPGPDGYPATEDWKYIAMMLKGQIVMQTRDIQQCVGDGPLVAHLGFILSRDGAGHESGHYVVYQSWMPASGVGVQRARGDAQMVLDHDSRMAKQRRVSSDSDLAAADREDASTKKFKP